MQLPGSEILHTDTWEKLVDDILLIVLENNERDINFQKQLFAVSKRIQLLVKYDIFKVWQETVDPNHSFPKLLVTHDRPRKRIISEICFRKIFCLKLWMEFCNEKKRESVLQSYLLLCMPQRAQ